MHRSNNTLAGHRLLKFSKLHITRLATLMENGSALCDLQYAYDLNGNRSAKVGSMLMLGEESLHDTRIRYHYDSMDRLLEEDYNGETESYQYDLCGNRLSYTTIDGEESYHYNNRNQLIKRNTADDSISYTYNAQGNITTEIGKEGITKYGYSLFNRQSSVETKEGGILESLYDGEGLRAGTNENGKKFTFQYYNGELLTEKGEEQSNRFILGNGVVASENSKGEGYYCYHSDEQLSTAYITNPSQRVANYYFYNAFGNIHHKEEQVINRITYTGQQYDQVTGQYYLRARFYNPVVGRFLQEDEYHGDGLNLYAYCGNNPVVYYDPNGFKGDDCPGSNDSVDPKNVNEGNSKDANKVKNWKDEDVTLPEGHVMSPRDPNFSQPPIVNVGPFTSEQKEGFLKGNVADTKLAPHHRHQVPIRDGGIMDELQGTGHPKGNEHTKSSPSRHPGPSVFNKEKDGVKLRQDEIKEHWKSKGERLTQTDNNEWTDFGPE